MVAWFRFKALLHCYAEMKKEVLHPYSIHSSCSSLRVIFAAKRINWRTMVRLRNSGWKWLENIYTSVNKGGLISLGNIADRGSNTNTEHVPGWRLCQKKLRSRLGLHLCVPLLRPRLYEAFKSGKCLPFPFKVSGERTVLKKENKSS